MYDGKIIQNIRWFNFHLPIVSVPASAQHNSSVLQSMASEFGNLIFGPLSRIERPLPSKLDHSNFGSSLFQSDQNTFLKYWKTFYYYYYYLEQVTLEYTPLKKKKIPSPRMNSNASWIDQTICNNSFTLFGI